MQRLYKILHFFVTLFFTVLLNSRYYINLTKRKIHWAFSDENAESKILTEVATLTSLPRHLTLILLESNVDLTILAKIIVWSFTIGISYVSVYSTDGKLKQCKRHFRYLAEKSYKLYFAH